MDVKLKRLNDSSNRSDRRSASMTAYVVELISNHIPGFKSVQQNFPKVVLCCFHTLQQPFLIFDLMTVLECRASDRVCRQYLVQTSTWTSIVVALFLNDLSSSPSLTPPPHCCPRLSFLTFSVLPTVTRRLLSDSHIVVLCSSMSSPPSTAPFYSV